MAKAKRKVKDSGSTASDFLGKVPPQDLEAEKSVLGSLLFSSEAFDEVIQHIQSRCFYTDAHRKIFQCIHDMYEKGVRALDVITLKHELEKRDEFEDIGGAVYLNEVMGAVPHAAHAEYYAKIVRDTWLQRSLIEACTDSLREAYHGNEDVEEILAKAEKRVFGIVEQQENIDKIDISDILDSTFQRIYERMDQEGTVSGLHTGFNGLDDFTSGFQPSELIVLAARPSMGKTALVCNFAMAVSKAERGVLLFSLEQSKIELAERLLCIQAKISGHKLRQGELDEFEQSMLMEASNEMRKFHMFIDDTAGRTMSQISAIARRLKRRAVLDIVIIDYLQLIETEDKSMPREQQISSITRRLKFLAKDLDIPVIALAQLNRGVEQREDKRPRLSDLRESGAIEQDADIVMFLHRPEAYDPEDRPGEADLIIAKNRHGPIGTVELTWLREMLKFGDKSPMTLPEGMDF
ncbi:replicative DNA helicase [Thalassoglobus polymorphus]|uniref:Replicative DNA helicase n=1 Tax=Thalassoglobus polymorphus TaxID=2527994 RepID=A0A517QRZ1_9PLAN|nr:replicative DNA helicase [Thalassoglobus polymorphus]QDT34382.1 Replicative DNA helicase [Thalassoglobus polymorphus]